MVSSGVNSVAMDRLAPCEDRSGAIRFMGDEAGGRSNWFQQHPRTVDLVVVLAVFAYNLPIQFGSVPDDLWSGTGVVLSVGLCGPYLLRRRYPVGAFVAVQTVAFVQVLLGVELMPADLMLLFVVYNLAVKTRWAFSVVATVVTLGWLLAVTVPTMARDHLSVGDVGVLFTIVVWAWTWGFLVQNRRRYIESLRQRAEQLEREKATEAAMAAVTERTRIAREIHDIVSHGLSVVVVMSDGAAKTVDSAPEQAKTAMLGVRDTGRAALADMRRMLGVLRNDEPGSRAPQPGIAELDRLVEDSAVAGLPVSFSVAGESGVEPIPTSVDLAVFRIVQEALTNARRHAGPEVTRVDVRIAYQEDTIEVSVVDDGKGPAGCDGTGRGLIGMRERVAAHGGVLRTGARPGGGFEVVASLPKRARQ